MKEGVLTRQNVFVSVLVFVLRPLALLAAVQQLALLLLQSLNGGEKVLLSAHGARRVGVL